MIIEINLLPHREARRVADLRQMVAFLVLGLVLLAGAVFFVHGNLGRQRDVVQTSVRQKQADLDRFKPQQVKGVARVDALEVTG